MSVHPEDVAGYVADLHRDLARIAAALERVSEVLEGVTTDNGKVRVDVGREHGRLITVEDAS